MPIFRLSFKHRTRFRRRVVGAGILPAILQAGLRGKDDLIVFTADCVLPILGPSFSQSDGGTSIVPLLDHNDPRIRAAVTVALRSAVDSRYGNVDKMVEAGMVSRLHSAMDEMTTSGTCGVISFHRWHLSCQSELRSIFCSPA